MQCILISITHVQCHFDDNNGGGGTIVKTRSTSKFDVQYESIDNILIYIYYTIICGCSNVVKQRSLRRWYVNGSSSRTEKNPMPAGTWRHNNNINNITVLSGALRPGVTASSGDDCNARVYNKRRIVSGVCSLINDDVMYYGGVMNFWACQKTPR